MLLFIDTETTGKFDFKLPTNHPRQPRLVQLAAVVTDEFGAVMAQGSVLIRPDGWAVPPAAQAVHGFSTHQCAAFGIPLRAGLELLTHLAARARTVVAHNLEFDAGVLDGEMRRAGLDNPLSALDPFCTMKAATPVCRIPGPYGHKWPQLAEAHRFLLGSDFDGAHDALADVLACMRCYFELRKRQAPPVIPVQPPPPPTMPGLFA